MSEYPIPEDLQCVGDLFPHRYRAARDDEGFALGHLLPCDIDQWISTVHAFAVAKRLIERIAKQDAEIERLRGDLLKTTQNLSAELQTVIDLKAQVERLSAWQTSVLRRRGLSDAPCDVCGYNGGGYYQPSTHPCAARAAIK